MGWKASCIFVTEGGPGYFAAPHPNDSDRCRQLAASLGFKEYVPVGETKLEDGIYPDRHIVPRRLCLGCYEHGAIVAHNSLWSKTSARRPTPGDLADRAIEAFPEATVLAIGLHSVTNFWAFALYDHGRLVRYQAGAADEGLMSDIGPPLAEEEGSEDGEDRVLRVAARMTGTRLDQEGPHWSLSMTAFEKKTLRQSFLSALGLGPK